MYSEALASCQRGECEAVCFKEGGSWFNPAPNFDSTPEGIWALFVITSLENWQEVLYNAVDSRGVLLQPIQRERLGWSWRQDFSAVYFAAFILVNVILMTNLFVGVVCSEFQMSKRKKERLTNLNAEKREWVLVHDLLVQYAPLRLPRQPRKDASALQRWCFEVFYHGAYAPPLPDLRKKGAKVGARQQGQQQGQAESPRRLARKSPAQIDRARERRRVRAAGARRGEAGEGDSGAQRGGATSGGAADEVGKGSTESPTPPARSWSPSWDEEDTRSASFFVSVAVFAVNMLSLACVVAEFQGMGAEYELVLALTQACCSFLLWLNIVAKVIAIGLPLYWSVSPWDRLELVLEIATPVYCGCRIASFYAQVPGLDHRQLRLLGAVRALRFFRLLTVGWFHLVGAMINALLVALPAVANLVVLIFFWVIAFDFIGVSLFQGAIIADSYPDGDGLSDDFNFATLGKGFLVLCVLLRFEGWAALCADLLTCEYTTARPPAWTIYVFFVVYLVTAVYMMLSVFIALLLDTLEQLNATTGNTVDQRALRRLRDRWSELDPAGDEMIDIAQLGALLRSLGEPFVEAADVSTAASLTRLLVELELPVYLPERKQAGAQGKALLPEGAEVTYIEVAHALAKRAVTGGDPSQFTHYELDPALERIVMSRLPKAYPIVRHLSNNRTFTCEVAVARAIAAGAFDPRRSSRSDLVEGSDDGSDDDFFISEGPHDDLDLGVARPARDGSIRQIRIM
ncbi:hypothetical protein T492DRAFT_1146624 [Pavlovales sp. CCMP2436]|nr:hypothetical protein T492DRAFT_1146624 [Pavlovales sp. CCMP2436]